MAGLPYNYWLTPEKANIYIAETWYSSKHTKISFPSFSLLTEHQHKDDTCHRHQQHHQPYDYACYGSKAKTSVALPLNGTFSGTTDICGCHGAVARAAESIQEPRNSSLYIFSCAGICRISSCNIKCSEAGRTRNWCGGCCSGSSSFKLSWITNCQGEKKSTIVIYSSEWDEVCI